MNMFCDRLRASNRDVDTSRNLDWPRHLGLVAILVVAVSGSALAQPSGNEAIVSALNRENSTSHGRLMFRVEVTPLGREQMFPHRSGDMPAGHIYLHFYWLDSDPWRWRVDTLDEEKKPLDSIICDGASIDSGDAIWDIEFFTRAPPTELGAFFRKIEWPLRIVQNHVFPFGMIGRRDADRWKQFYKITSEYAPDGSDIVLFMEDQVPRAGIVEIIRIEDDGGISKSSTQLNEPELVAQTKHHFRVVLDPSNDFLPKLWKLYNPQIEESLRWTTPTKVQANDKVVVLPLVCEYRQGVGSEALVWRSTILIDESDIAKAPGSDQFTVEQYTAGGSGKDLVLFRRDESDESWLDWFLDTIR
jgi:hypothetical protein